MNPHFCPVCRCRFPNVPPQMESTTVGKMKWLGMVENNQRLAAEVAQLRKQLSRQPRSEP